MDGQATSASEFFLLDLTPSTQIFRLIERQANLHKEAAHFVKERKAVASHST